MFTAKRPSFLLVLLVAVVFSDSGCLAAKPRFCGNFLPTEPRLYPEKCPEPPCNVASSSRSVLPLPLLLSLHTDPYLTVLHTLTEEGRICGEVGVSQLDGSVHLLGGGCDVSEGDLPNAVQEKSDRVEGQWLHVEVVLEGETVTVHPLTAKNINVTLTTSGCLPSLLEVLVLRASPHFGYSALKTTTTMLCPPHSVGCHVVAGTVVFDDDNVIPHD